MGDRRADQGWFDWLQQDTSFVPETAEDLVITSMRVFQLNGRFLYLKATPDLAALSAGERRILGVLARQGESVFVAVCPGPGQVRLSYRVPDLENSVAFDADGLRGLIQQWSIWAASAESSAA